MSLEVKLTDAILGSVYKIKTPENTNLEVKIPSGVNNGELLRVRGKGVPYSGGRGDIIINIKIDMPSKLSRKTKDLIEKLREEGL